VNQRPAGVLPPAREGRGRCSPQRYGPSEVVQMGPTRFTPDCDDADSIVRQPIPPNGARRQIGRRRCYSRMDRGARARGEGANQVAADEVVERRASSPRNCSKTLRRRPLAFKFPPPSASRAGNSNACSKSARRFRARAADRPRHQPFAGSLSDPKLRLVGPDRRCHMFGREV
jgi:hypothetical protein